MKHSKTFIISAFCFCLAGLVACSSTGVKKEPSSAGPSTDISKNEIPGKVPDFNADSAYMSICRQLAFGPRVTGTPQNAYCRQYIVDELRRYGADTVAVQKGSVTVFTGDELPIGNVWAQFAKDRKKRVLLIAHYDTRPWADADLNEDNRRKPVMGANDGASGVAVILEIARLLGQQLPPNIGVDLLLVDAEDYGKQSGFETHDDTWCLGTQYWVQHMPYAVDELPAYGILFDMVGGSGARFHREYFSDREAKKYVDKVWNIAQSTGYGDRFVQKAGGAVIDDHVVLNRAGIPAIDIIESKNRETHSFAPTWHTASDNIDSIDTSSLKAAGQTVVNVLFAE